MADGRDHWAGTLVVLFQPAEETGDGARGMVADQLKSVAAPSGTARGVPLVRGLVW